MKQIKRILSMVLVVLTILPMLTACAFRQSNTITKGEFFSLFMEETGLYYVSQTSTDEDIGYDAEAQAMVDWGLLPSETAFDNLDAKVTKETVVTVCVNNMYFVKEGDVSTIKDAKKCSNPQLMADAVATGIAELEKGYFDAKEKLTKKECVEYIQKSLEIDANSHFKDGTGSFTYDFGEDVQVFSGDDIDPNDIQVLGYTNEQYDIEDNNNEENGVVQTACNLTDANMALDNMPGLKLLDEQKSGTFRLTIPKEVFEKVMKYPKIGDEIVYLPWQGDLAQRRISQKMDLHKKSFAGRLKSVQAMPLTYECELEYLDDETIVKGMKPDKYGKDIKGDNLSEPVYETEVDGFSIRFSKENNGYSVKVEKTFKISQNEYNNWRDWTVEPRLTCSASITDFHLDCDNISAIFSKSKEEKALVDLSYKVNQTTELESGGLRLAPDSNRNGKFASNISKSRFTAGAGAKYVKVGGIKIKIPQIGLEVPITLYLEISVDGKVKIVFDESTNIRLIKQNGNVKLAKETCKSKSFEVTGNIDAGLRLEAGVNFALIRKSIVCVYGKIGTNITVYSKIYEDKKLIDRGYADAEDLKHERSVQDDMHFCLEISGYGYLEIGLCEGASYGSLLADLVDLSKMKIRAEGEKQTFLHLEDGLSFTSNAVKKCTMDDGKLEVNEEGEIELESYKENLSINAQISINILSVPMKESKIEDNGGFKIKVEDGSIARVEYDKTLNVLHIYGLKEGSTEVEIIITKTPKTGKKKATYYKQEVSVTVTSEKVAQAV